ncbi:RNA-directed DNA polymerase, eukaryota, nucleotide-binding alpha-beta plait domain protein [Tanacetum coccineum]
MNVPKKNTAQGNGLMGFQQKKGAATSYTSAVNGENSQVRPGNSVSLAPALVLDEECIMERDFSNCAMGRVKAFDSIIKLQSILVDEVNSGKPYWYYSWFQVIHDVSQDFVSDERVVWIDIEGVPLYAWSRKSFEKIGSKWGELLNIEDASDSSFGRKRLCILTKHPVSIFESFKIIVKGKVFMVRAKELFTWNPTFESIKTKSNFIGLKIYSRAINSEKSA